MKEKETLCLEEKNHTCRNPWTDLLITCYTQNRSQWKLFRNVWEFSSLRTNGEKRTNFSMKSELPPEICFLWEMQHMSVTMDYCFASLTAKNQAVFSDITGKKKKSNSEVILSVFHKVWKKSVMRSNGKVYHQVSWNILYTEDDKTAELFPSS